MLELAMILGVLIAILATVASLGVVVVDVREGGPDGSIRTAALTGALGSLRFTDLVEVHDGNDHVRVWVW